MARPIDRESLLVQKIANAAYQQDFVMLVVASIAATLDGFELRELLFPIAQHVRFHRTKIADLADREVPLGGDRRKLGLNSTVIRHGSPLRPSPSTFDSRGT